MEAAVKLSYCSTVSLTVTQFYWYFQTLAQLQEASLRWQAKYANTHENTNKSFSCSSSAQVFPSDI